MYSVIVLSGGKGRRMENKVPKQYLLLAGKPIIMHSLERIDMIPEVGEIVVVCEKDYVPAIEKMVGQYNITTKIVFADAGATRQESVFSGLQKVSNDKVIIHEAARPFAKTEDFLRLINDSAENITLGYSVPYTVVQGRENISGLLERESLVNIQLPQKFKTSTLMRAHNIAHANKKEFTEDAGMVYACTGTEVKIVRGTSQNIKITEPIDLVIGEIIYEEYIKVRR